MSRFVIAGIAAAVVLTVATAARVSDPAVRFRPAVRPHPRVIVVRRAAPLQRAHADALVIPAISVDAPLVSVGAVGAPGSATLAIPQNIHAVAWWDGEFDIAGRRVHRPAPMPGQAGVALIAGHLDSATAGPGALYRLSQLRTGDRLQVTLHGRTSAWQVASAPQLTPKTALPRALFRTAGPPRLALVTCGGGFDMATGHYLDNVIVWAVPSRG